MADEAIAWPTPPTLTDADDNQSYFLGTIFTVTVGRDCSGVRWGKVPTTLENPPGGTHLMTLWAAGVRVRSQAFTPVGGATDQDVPFTTQGVYALVPGVTYIAAVWTEHYTFRSGSGVFSVASPSGNVVATQGSIGITSDPNSGSGPDTPNSSIYYISPLVSDGASSSPVTTTLTGKFRVYGKASSAWTGKFRVFAKVSSTFAGKYSVFGKVSSVLASKWRVFTGVATTFTGKWRVLERVATTLTVKWHNFGAPVEPPVVSSGYLNAQRAATLAYIRDDPTTIEFTPSARVPTPAGGFTEQDGVVRAAQTVKMILLAYDQRPTVTLAGVERVIDYHLMGRWDMLLAVGDYWVDDEGTRWDVVGFSEGWDYMTKAFVSRHVPRNARP